MASKRCDEDGCTESAPLYRQCANNACKKEVGYCKQHGGDDRALAEMTSHINRHKEKDTQP